MDQDSLIATRRSLHGVAELVLAGPQYAGCGDIRLRATPGGFGTWSEPDLRVVGDRVVGVGVEAPLAGTYADLAAAVGHDPRALRDVYEVGPEVVPDDEIVADPAALAILLPVFEQADAALKAFAPDQERVLWPEHFDLGISLGEVNYGVSPGDGHLAVPYAYVGPWQPRAGAFWNTGFGAARTLDELGSAAALEEFFREGSIRADADPPVVGTGTSE